jgi:hypothetical protein
MMRQRHHTGDGSALGDQFSSSHSFGIQGLWNLKKGNPYSFAVLRSTYTVWQISRMLS